MPAVLLALLLLVGMGAPLAVAAPQASNETVATLGIAPPDVSAKAVYALDMTSGAVLYAKNADAKLPIASITKVITALVTVNHVGLTEQVTIAQEDLLDPNSTFTKMNLRAGDVLSVADLLEGLLLPSGGDAANALARYVGGKIANTTDGNAALTAFIDEMNAYAKSLGLTESYFTNVAGDDDQGAFSSAHDLAIIGSQLMKNADLAWMVAQPSMQVASQNGDPYVLTNTNKMLQPSDAEYDPNVVGITTGSTEGAGASVLLARKANEGQSTVILVVLGSTLEYDENYTIVTDQR
ncbi:MAG: D-alanyl-D-alanine carboxypeptidase family protein, partial [Thermomicrobiales bacterium]